MIKRCFDRFNVQLKHYVSCNIMFQNLTSVHPETQDECILVSVLEASNFLQGQGNQAFERRRSTLRRTIKGAD